MYLPQPPCWAFDVLGRDAGAPESGASSPSEKRHQETKCLFPLPDLPLGHGEIRDCRQRGSQLAPTPPPPQHRCLQSVPGGLTASSSGTQKFQNHRDPQGTRPSGSRQVALGQGHGRGEGTYREGDAGAQGLH